MTVYVSMQAPTTWPFLTPVVPAHLMPSGNAYRPDASGQIQANQADVGALAGYGFALPSSGAKFPSITDTGTLVTIAADSKITGSLDVSEHLHFHESADPGTPNAGGVIFADTSDHKLKYTFHDGTITNLSPGVTPISDASYALSAVDRGQALVFSSASAVTLTVAAGLGSGFECLIIQSGAGQVTPTAAMGVTIHNRQSQTKTAGQYAVMSLLAVAADTFILAGDGA